MLEKQFIINKDYNLLLYQQVKQCNQTKGGHNKETFMLNLKMVLPQEYDLEEQINILREKIKIKYNLEI